MRGVTGELRRLKRWGRSRLEPVWLAARRTLAGRGGPPYPINRDRVIIDVTFRCALRCLRCDRSCRDAPSDDDFSPEQMARFIAESRAAGVAWRSIALEGGEPLLHPQFAELVDVLHDYVTRDGLRTSIVVVTSGQHPETAAIVGRLPATVRVKNSNKRSADQPSHLDFAVAAADLAHGREPDYAEGCPLPTDWGLGLNRYGFYPHPVCGGIDRVFGLNVGRRRLPDAGDAMRDQMRALCRLCGFFAARIGLARAGARNEITPSWRAAYDRYQLAPPALTRY